MSFKQSSSKDNTCVKGIGNIEIGLALKFKIESFLQFLMFSSIVDKSKKEQIKIFYKKAYNNLINFSYNFCSHLAQQD